MAALEGRGLAWSSYEGSQGGTDISQCERIAHDLGKRLTPGVAIDVRRVTSGVGTTGA